ncbi:MAG: AMMECR1 domain-containing protein [Defluviitaleaceae bacterium]|nr:AMMECR1 domain-containing protein [Defluviitaleaceae bacterium]
MAIIRAYILPHPKLAIPAVGRGEERKIVKTLSSLDMVAQEIAFLRPETIIFITPHNVIYDDYFHISPGIGAKGNCSALNTRHVKLSLKYDPNFAAVTSHIAGKYGIIAKTLGEKKAPLDHGVVVPLWFINRRFSKFKTMRISPSKLDEKAHYRLGQALSEAASNIGRRTVIIASGNLSRDLNEKAKDGYVDEALEYDKTMVDIMQTGDFGRLFTVPHSLRDSADPCNHSIFAVLAGALDKRMIRPEMLSYENNLGEGYAVAAFAPGPYDERRNFLEKSEEVQRRLVVKTRSAEDAYCILARRALEYAVLHRLDLPIPMGLPKEMLTTRAGVFVSLYIDNTLRGAAGALDPTADNIAAEIAKYAVAAGQSDKRFPAIDVDELPDLVYKVDIIGSPEPVQSSGQLDVQRYGLIVTSPHTWGVMLPNHPGITTGEEQIAAVMQRAGIAPGTLVKLERFLVVRHE